MLEVSPKQRSYILLQTSRPRINKCKYLISSRDRYTVLQFQRLNSIISSWLTNTHRSLSPLNLRCMRKASSTSITENLQPTTQPQYRPLHLKYPCKFTRRSTRLHISKKKNGFPRWRLRQRRLEQAVRPRQAGTPAIRHERGSEG
jgi:hypothetical protein